jgi:hypothetical protein
MKISESTSYPHPVLAPWSSDISGAMFRAEVSYREEEQSNQLSIHCAATLDQPDIVALIRNGFATLGCLIRCQETGFRRLQPIGFPTGSHDFAPGALLGRVQIRPIIWSTKPIPHYRPIGVHMEFSDSLDIEIGEILALDKEKIIEVTRPPLPAIESIFEIKSSEELPENRFEIDAELDRVLVRMGVKTYKLVQELRVTDINTQIAVMNSLYVPIVMEVLTQLKERGYEPFESYRWLHPFKARCELSHIDIQKADFLNDAQKLLSFPFATQKKLTQYEGEEQ